MSILASVFVLQLAASALIVAPPDQVRIRFDKPQTGVVVLTWREAPGAVNYRVVVSGNRALKKPVLDSTLAGRSVDLRGLPTGHYQWRVEALSSAKVVLASDTASFSIQPAKP